LPQPVGELMQTVMLERDSLTKVKLRMMSAFRLKAEYAQVRTKEGRQKRCH
jgi:hypothetical protein